MIEDNFLELSLTFSLISKCILNCMGFKFGINFVDPLICFD